MRILAIRGENLASLAEPFALEFEQEPLRSCGLFAITGETGAGKSTILDALCLALYDTFPRVEATKESERAPDPSGELLKIRDPAPILRRGAGAGHAEVDFIARDGLRYRARCGLQRARGKAGGNLQPRRRSLWRIDANGLVIEAIESGIAPVNRRIVELTDLTFDQFCRTALLAQGDFDAFLRADAGNRADLLEKITGAEIYGRLSQRAYEKARLALETLAQLQQRHDDIGLFTEEELASRQSEIEMLSQTRAETECARAAIQDSLRRLETHARAQEKLALAETDLEIATRALDELAPQAAQLELAGRVEPLRNLWRDMRNADEVVQRQSAAARHAELKTVEAEKTLARADEEEKAARLSLHKVEQIIAEMTPLWAQASELDVRIAEGAKLAAQAQREVEAARAMANEKQRECEAALTAQAEKLRACEAAQFAFNRCAPARPLAERMPEIADWLAKRLELSRDNQQAHRETGDAAIELDRIGQSLASIAAADMKDRDERDALAAQIAEREQALTSLDEESVSMKVAQIGAEVMRLQALSRPAATYVRAKEAFATAEGMIADRIEIVDQLTLELEGLLNQRARVATESAEATRLGELAAAAADPHALQLRATLEDGTPCPVCGAQEHPFSHNVDAAQQLVDALRARRETARNALDRLDLEIFRTEAAAAATRAETETAQRQQVAAEAESAEAVRAYAALLSGEQSARVPSSIQGALSIIEQQLAEHEIETQALTSQLEMARRLRNERDRLTKGFNSRRDALDQRQSERHAMVERQQNLSKRVTQLAATLAHHGERIASIDRSVAPFLELCDLTVGDLDRDPESVQARLAQAGQRFQLAQQTLDRLTLERNALDVRVAILTSEGQAAVDTLAAQTRINNARASTLEDLRGTRAGLLGAEATSDHRQRHEDTRKACFAELDRKRAERSVAGERAAAARMLAGESAREVEAAMQALQVAQDAFLKACAVSGMSQQTAMDLLARPQEEVDCLRARLRLAEESCSSARTTVVARRQDVETSGAGLPVASQDDLIAHEGALAERLETTTARMGALREQIRLDETARQRAESLLREIVAARATGKLWEEINAAIGSRSGDRFRRFAQSVTLDQLVALANQRLVLLSPRYRLEKSGEIDSLGLQIIDRDLGDERRSTRSLSGGERFLASLALALALAGLEGRDSFVDTLFIDEGFGSLDSMTLDVAIDALESLQGQGRKVGVISHVDSLQQRISTKISVERRGGGLSVVKLRAPGWAA